MTNKISVAMRWVAGAIMAAGVILPQTLTAQTLGGGAVTPTRATANSIYNWKVTWSWDANRYPWAGQLITLTGPEEVFVGEWLQLTGVANGAATITIPAAQLGNGTIDLLGVRGVWDNPRQTGTNYYTDGTPDGTGTFNTTGEITLAQSLPASLPTAGTVWVQYVHRNSTVKFRLPQFTASADNHHEIRQAAGYTYTPLRQEPTGAPSEAGPRGCGDFVAIDGQPLGRQVDQGSAPDGNGWRQVGIPNPAAQCFATYERFVRVAGAAEGTSVNIPPHPEIPADEQPFPLPAFPEGNWLLEQADIIGIWDNPAATGTNYAAGGELVDPITGEYTLGEPLPEEMPNGDFVWVLVRFTDRPNRGNTWYTFNAFNQTVQLRVPAHRVVEDVDVDPYGDGMTFFTRGTPVIGVSGVFPLNVPIDPDQPATPIINPVNGRATDLYGSFGTFRSFNTAGATDQFAIQLGTPVPSNVRRVRLIYWVGPVTVNAGNGISYTRPNDIIGQSGNLSFTTPISMAPNLGTNSPDGGTEYIVSGSRGLNLLNNPRGVPNLWYMSAPGGDPPPVRQFRANHINYSNDVAQRVSDTNSADFGRWATAAKTQDITGPTVFGSRTGNEGIVRRQGVNSVDFVNIALSPFQTLVKVEGVWDNQELSGVNYFTGGNFTGAGVVALGTQLPSIDTQVWVAFVVQSNSRWGGGGSEDILGAMTTPIGGADPLIWDPLVAEQYTKDLARNYIYFNEPRQFVPFQIGAPDDGNSSTTFAFRVRYYNDKNLPPQPWWPEVQRNLFTSAGISQNSGVYMYIKFDGEDDYMPYGMTWTNPIEQTYTQGDGVGFVVKLEPNAGFSGWYTGSWNQFSPPYWSGPNNYIAIPVGMHRYFFAASDDVLLYHDPDRVVGPPDLHPNPLAEWAETPAIGVEQKVASDGWDTPIRRPSETDLQDVPVWLEPTPPTLRPGDPPVVTSTQLSDPFSYVDKTGLQPGVGAQTYTLPATQHPVVHGLLSGIPFGPDATGHLGGFRFLGTLTPYTRYVNPTFQYPATEGFAQRNDNGTWVRDVRVGAPGSQLIETAGGTSSTVFTFRVIYQSFDPITKIGRAPTSAKVFINNTADASGAYTGYPMNPVKNNPTAADYKAGIQYEYKTTLPAGPHTYYFEFDSGFGPIRFPVRPDGRIVEAGVAVNGNNPGPWWGHDPWVIGDAPYADNNDYVPGPYVNSKPVLSNPSVTPSSGASGTEFVYRVTYTDADNQRPMMSDLIIELSTGNELRLKMSQTNLAATDYTAGVEFRYRVSSVQAESFPPGKVLRYRFEFADDWGRRTDLNDIVPGETVRLPESGTSVIAWLSGPTVLEIKRPRLKSGSVTSDGSSTPSTVWTYQVSYFHDNNTAPSFVNVYIGSQRSEGDPNNARPLERLKPINATSVKALAVPVLSVTGVWTSSLGPNASGNPVNYYTGGSFNASTGVITLGTPLPDAGRDVWVTYAANPITWDDGNPMSKRDASDLVFSDGAVYIYQTTLPGPQLPGELPIRYFYSFQASDGVFVSRYDQTTSEAAFARTRQPFSPLLGDSGEILDHGTSTNGRTIYQTQFFPIVGPLPPTAVGSLGVLTEPKLYKNGNLLARESFGQLDSSDTSVTVTVASNGQTINVPASVVTAVRGVYSNPNRTGTDYYNAGGQGSYTINTVTGIGTIALGQAIPAGVRPVYIDYYNRGDYQIDFVNGKVVFTTANQLTDTLELEYWWSGVGPSAVGLNNPPMLSEGKFTPNNPSGVDGTSSTLFTFTVKYTETDGPIGQAPTFIRVVIDGQPFDMQRVGTGTPIYRNGITYTYSTSLSGGSHVYYFEASDGTGFAAFDAEGGKTSFTQITAIVPMEGPLVNDLPTLTSGSVTPNPTLPNRLPIGTPVTYRVTYRDPDGDAPNVGFPRVWVDNPNETVYAGKVSAISGNTLTVSGANWTAGTLAGKLLQVTTGLVIDPDLGTVQTGATASGGKIFEVIENGVNTVVINVASAASEGIIVGDTVSVASLVMSRENPSQNNYRNDVVFAVVVPAMPIGDHQYHFSVTAPPTNTLVRFPSSGELNGPNVSATPPAGNRAPVLTAASPQVNPTTGLTTTTFTFQVNYSDADNDPAGAHDGVFGYVKLVFDNNVYPAQLMSPTSTPGTWTVPVEHRVDVTGLPPGTHKFHFEASDGYRAGATIVRFPANAANDPTVRIAAKPVLSIGAGQGVSPTIGTPTTNFTFSVTYTDADNDAPQSVQVEINGTAYNMTKQNASDNNYTDGAAYVYTTTLPVGNYTYRFTATDGTQAADPTGLQSGPTVLNPQPPTLSDGDVDPDSGPASTQFTFSVRYTDANPATSVTVHIDGNASGLVMTDANNDNVWESSPVTLSGGTHTYYFQASNGLGTARLPASGAYNGPIVTGASLTLDVSPQTPNLGDTFAVSGTLTPGGLTPRTITLVATRPDQTTVTQVVNLTSSNTYSANLAVADVTGVWTITATWAGGSGFPQEVRSVTRTVGGLPISVVANRVDMIGITLIPSNTDPEVIFGSQAVANRLSLAYWKPDLGRYLLYPGDAATLRFSGAEGFWIRPQQTESVAVTGQLWPQTTAYSKVLNAGWNQISSVYVTPLPLSKVFIRYQGQTRTLAQAAEAGWARDYLWGYDPTTRQYVLVQQSLTNNSLITGRGYWIRALVDCELVYQP